MTLLYRPKLIKNNFDKYYRNFYFEFKLKVDTKYELCFHQFIDKNSFWNLKRKMFIKISINILNIKLNVP